MGYWPDRVLFGNQPFIADMTAAALRGHFDTTERLREAFMRRAHLLCDAAATIPGLSATMPQGGMFVMVDVSGTGMDGDAFAWRLLEEYGVAVMPGSAFGANAQALIRVSLTVPDEALKTALGLVAKMCEVTAAA